MSNKLRAMVANSKQAASRDRILVTAGEIDFESTGRRDYYVKIEHPTIWGSYLVPLTVIVGQDAKPGEGVLAIGSTHGNEYEGPVAIKHILRDIHTEDVLGRIILIPVLNVAAFKAGTRDTPEDGKNLNREFPGDAGGSITQRFADLITTHVFPHAHVVLDIHSGGKVARFSAVSSFHKVQDAEQYRHMQQVAKGFGCGFTMVYQDETPGLLTSLAERLGKITVGTELGYGQALSYEGVAMGKRGILNAAMYSGQLKNMPLDDKIYEDQKLIDGSAAEASLIAACDSIFEPCTELGVQVEEGQLLAFLHRFDDIDEQAIEIRAPRSGYVICQAWEAPVQQGQTVVLLGQHIDWCEQ